MSNDKPENELSEITEEDVEKAVPELSVDEEREQCQATCEALDKDIDVINVSIAARRHDKNVAIAKKDVALARIEELRPKPGEELPIGSIAVLRRPFFSGRWDRRDDRQDW